MLSANPSLLPALHLARVQPHMGIRFRSQFVSFTSPALMLLCALSACSSEADPSSETPNASADLSSGQDGSSENECSETGGCDEGDTTLTGDETDRSTGGTSSGSGGTVGAETDPLCVSGIPNAEKTACCAKSCGSCGGEACGERPGGAEACCSGRILDSGISCDESDAPCAVAGEEQTGTGGSGTDGEEIGVPQPPEICSNIDFSIPEDVRVHTVLDKTVLRAEFGDFSKWYTEDENMQRFQLHEGDQNTTSQILRPRVEAYSPPPRWTRTGQNDWHEFSANYYFSGWDEPQLYAVFQIKTNDASNFIIQGLVEKDGSLQFARRGKGRVTVADDVMREPFHLRVRSNGYKFEVWLNCELVLAEDHPQPELEDNNTQYGWRWGLYRQQTADDLQKGTTELFVTGPMYD